MTEENAGPRDRLLDAARELFYRQGPGAVGVNELIEASGTHKASFYRHFASRDALALEYLREQGRSFRALLTKLTARASHATDFVHRWVSLLKKQERRGEFLGCPLARFMSGLAVEDPQWAVESRAILDSWHNVLAGYLQSLSGNRTHAEDQARALIKAYQANAQLYAITRDRRYFTEMEADMLAALEKPPRE
ncbi:MAG: TetR/AcrR family transcriptional regulator [Spirochaetales bacterium]|nr:TetR/AcrR family transcriptional regulator [Spirochaetales bacterium]MCP5484836.1 TetR/AcrR family transcriptional regulator [Spirochaetales bacterium]